MNTKKCTKSVKNRFGRQKKKQATLLAGCKKTRLTRMLSQKKNALAQRFSSKSVFRWQCAGHRHPGCRGSVSQVWAFFVGETCLFQTAGALRAGLLLDEKLLPLGFGCILRTTAESLYNALSNEKLLPLGFGCYSTNKQQATSIWFEEQGK